MVSVRDYGSNGIENGSYKTTENGHDVVRTNVDEKPKNNDSIISFHDIWYEVQQKVDDKPLFGKKAPKNILKGVSGFFSPGVNAIMGPTGSGKTSLLDILAMRKDPVGLKKGKVLLNGMKIPSNFRLLNGYVVQDDDIVMGTLTVRENIAFSANLRLSKEKFTPEEITAKVEKVIKQLGLEDCANTLVGTELIRGVSGGERKRVNIGMELILDPPVLFLDEPTTGLDANTANSIVLLLCNLAKEDNRTLVLSIHQPRYSIFKLFDKLLILTRGEIVYNGGSTLALDYFKEIGYPCPQYHNPADFFLDIVGGDVKTKKLLKKIKSQRSKLSLHSEDENNCENNNVKFSAQKTPVVEELEDEIEQVSFIQKLITEFKESSIGKLEASNLQSLEKNLIETSSQSSFGSKIINSREKSSQYATSFGHQMNVLCKRTVINIVRNPMTSVAHIGMVVFFGFLIGLVYWQVEDVLPEATQNRAGVFFFLILAQVTSNLSALETFISKRKHFIHESASGYYRVSSYFLSQTIADIIPYRIFPQILCALICYWMIGLSPGANKFFFFTLVQVLTCLAAASICFIASTSTDVFAIANIMVAIPYTIMLIFGGFLVNISSLLNWLEWLKYLSLYRYGYNGLMVNEMTGKIFINNASYPGYYPDSPNPCYSNVTNSRIPYCITGEEFMDQQDITYGVWGMWQNVVALIVMFIGLMGLAYIQLLRVPKYK